MKKLIAVADLDEPASRRATRLSFALYAAGNRMVRLHKPILDPLGLTFPQYLVLTELFAKSPRTVGELGSRVAMDAGTITPLLKRLEAAGRVSRLRDPRDERRVLVSLTEAGEALRDAILVVVDQVKSACEAPDLNLDLLRHQLDQLAHPRPEAGSVAQRTSIDTRTSCMNIGIIGAGNIGSTVAREIVAAGHSVKLAGSKGADAVRDRAEKIGAKPVSADSAVDNVDVIVLSIPFGEIPRVAGLFVDVPKGVVIIDTSNYYPQRDGRIADVEAGLPESVWVSERLGRPVVKAFNAVLADTLDQHGKPDGATGRIALPVAGDDPHGKAIAMELVNITGFDAVDAGALSESWRHQPGTPAYCTGLSAAELETALAAADRDRAPINRDALIEEFMAAGSVPTHETGTARNRVVTATG